jgi:hypothetical protein
VKTRLVSACPPGQATGSLAVMERVTSNDVSHVRQRKS